MRSHSVLFVVSEVAHYGEFKKLLCDSHVSSAINGLILFDRDGYDPHLLLEKEIYDAKKNGFSFIVTDPASIGQKPTPLKRGLLKTVFICKTTLLRKLPLIPSFIRFAEFILQVSSLVTFYKEKVSYLQKTLKQYDIETIVLGEENVLLDTFLFKKSAAAHKVLIYPYTIPNQKEMAGGAHRTYQLSSTKGKLLTLLGGRWVKVLESQVFVLLPFSKILSFWMYGYYPKNPWTLNFDIADKVLLESESMAKLYRHFGFASSKLKVIGSLNDDIISRVRSSKTNSILALQKKYSLSIDRPIVLVGFPPDQFPRKQIELQSYDEMIDVFVTTLSPYLDRFSILVCKHPRIVCSLEKLTENGFIICDEPTIEIIPLAHIYIASASATIRWAIASGVPVINYDLYRYEYSDYDSVSAVLHAVSSSEFTGLTNKILTDKNYFDELKAEQQLASSFWGAVDGKSAARIVQEILN